MEEIREQFIQTVLDMTVIALEHGSLRPYLPNHDRTSDSDRILRSGLWEKLIIRPESLDIRRFPKGKCRVSVDPLGVEPELVGKKKNGNDQHSSQSRKIRGTERVASPVQLGTRGDASKQRIRDPTAALTAEDLRMLSRGQDQEERH